MAVLHLISHTHWDREWYLPFQEFRLKLVHLIDGTLELLAYDRGFRYFMLDGQTIVLEDYLAVRREREREIASQVRSGRLLIGPWYVLPDEFLVSPEAIIRNLLEGGRIAGRFGRNMRLGYVPDPFGHIGQLPQILRGFDIETACVQRGLEEQPCEFWWQSPDGSRVLMVYLREGYGNAAGLAAEDAPRFVKGVRECADALRPYSAAGHLALMYGTDHMPPAAATSHAVSYSASRLRGDRLIHSTLPAYVAGVRRALGPKAKTLPVIEGELRSSRRWHLLPGILSMRMWIKQRNHTCEELLESWVEPFSAWAELLTPGGAAARSLPNADDRLDKPADVVREAWRLLLHCHPHDSICGTSVDQVHREMRPRFDQVEQMAEGLTRQSLTRLSEAIETRAPREAGEPAAAILVFNPLGWTRDDRVEVDLELGHQTGEFSLVDERGVEVPMERRGLGSRQLIHTVFDREGFRGLIGGVSDGNVAGMNLKDFHVRRDGARAHLEVELSEKGVVNRRAWETGMRETGRLLEDPTVTTFEVLARSAGETRVQFIAPSVPGFGYRTFFVKPQGDASSLAPVRVPVWVGRLAPMGGLLARLGVHLQLPSDEQEWRRGSGTIENESMRVSVDRRDGSFTLIHKPTRTILTGLNVLEDGGDCGDEYNFCPPRVDRIVRGARVRQVRTRRGSTAQEMRLQLVLRVPKELDTSRQSRSRSTVDMPVEVRAKLAPSSERLDITLQVDNLAKDHRLRALFPVGVHTAAADCDGHFEVVRRALGVPPWDGTWVEQPRPEHPQRRWVDVSDGTTGLMLANRGLPEVEVRAAGRGSEAALTLLRCVGWLSRDDFANRRGHAGPALETPEAQELGRHVFAYSIIPHRGRWTEAHRRAHEFGRPVRAVATTLHRGSLPSSVSLLQVQGGEFVVTAVKHAERGSGLIVRGVNLGSEAVRVQVRPWKKFVRCQLARMDEAPVSDVSLRRDGRAEIEVRPAQVVTLLFSAEARRSRR
jgi:alpha-mannosidase